MADQTRGLRDTSSASRTSLGGKGKAYILGIGPRSKSSQRVLYKFSIATGFNFGVPVRSTDPVECLRFFFFISYFCFYSK
jgi:hypothetical protein